MDGAERILTVVFYLTALAVMALAGLGTGFSGRELTVLEVALLVCLAVPTALLMLFSLFGLNQNN